MVTTRKQVSVPAEVCQALGIEAGWQLDWSIEDGHLHVHPIPPGLKLGARIRERARKWKIKAGQAEKGAARFRQSETRNEKREGRL